eukprot:gene10563-2687_t
MVTKNKNYDLEDRNNTEEKWQKPDGNESDSDDESSLDEGRPRAQSIGDDVNDDDEEEEEEEEEEEDKTEVDEDEADDDDDEEEEEEAMPRLSFKQLGASVPTILSDRVATCFAVSPKLAVLGTDLGTIHILDTINGTQVQQFTQHTERITDISIDRYGDYVATGSDDGKFFANVYPYKMDSAVPEVVIRNMYDTKSVVMFSFDRPIRSVAIDPQYPKKKKNMFITGVKFSYVYHIIFVRRICNLNMFNGLILMLMNSDGSFQQLHDRINAFGGKAGQLLLHLDKSFAFFTRTNATVLHSGEGCISIIRWRDLYVAWANDVGVKVYDTSINQRIASVDRPQNSPSPAEYQCRLCWKNDDTLLIGWADHIAVGEIRRRKGPLAPGDLEAFMQLLVRIETTFWISGIAPFDEDMGLLAYLDSEVELLSGKKAPCGDVPEFKVLTMGALETNSTDLEIANYDKYRANDYFFECIPEDNMFYIVSPQDIIVGKPLTTDQRIEWLLKHERYEEATDIADAHHSELQQYTPTQVKESRISHLLKQGAFDQAAALTPIVFGTDVLLWEKWVELFNRAGALPNLAKYIPFEEFRLSHTMYDKVLLSFLDTNVELFGKIMRKWVNVMTMTIIVEAVEKQTQKSLNIYLDLHRVEAFELLASKPILFQHVQDRIVDMINLNQERAIALLCEFRDRVPLKKVLPQLEQHPILQLEYLEAMASLDDNVGRVYGAKLVELTADHALHKLLKLLQTNHSIPYREALKICQEKHLWREYAYCLQRGGKVKEAMVLMITKLGLVEEAIELVAQENDESLWDDLIDQCFASDNPVYIRKLLANSGSYINPCKIIERSDLRGRVIEGLRDSLVKILSDFNLQIELLKGSTEIMMNDCVDLSLKLHRLRKRAIVVAPESTSCHQCTRTLSTFGTQDEALLFRCRHMFCRTCLEEFIAGRQRSRSIQNSTAAQPLQFNYCPICTRSSRGQRGAASSSRR